MERETRWKDFSRRRFGSLEHREPGSTSQPLKLATRSLGLRIGAGQRAQQLLPNRAAQARAGIPSLSGGVGAVISDRDVPERAAEGVAVQNWIQEAAPRLESLVE